MNKPKSGKNDDSKKSARVISRPVSGDKKAKPKQNFIKRVLDSKVSGARYSLIIGDEGAILIYIVGNEVQSRNFIAYATMDNLKEFEAILAKNVKAPLYVVIDSMDQSFVQQSLPPISSLGVKKLIERRLERDLGSNVVKGYVLLERDASGRRDWNFLMVSLENSPHLKLWFEFIEKVDNRLNGIYLLSVEAENIIKNIDKAMGVAPRSKKNPDASQWKFLVSHNKVGGFRQVILKNGRIIFTRLTQPVGEMTPEVIAGNIEHEMNSTIEYMKRLSFSQQSGLDIYIIASREINEALDLSAIAAKKINKFTPFEVAQFFDIKGAAQVSDQFGDVILAAFIASSKIHRLVLLLPSAIKVNRIYKGIYYQKAIVGLISIVLIGYGGMIGLGVLQKYSEIEDLTQKKIAQQRKFDELNEEIKKSGIDIKAVTDTVTLYNKMGSQAYSPNRLIARLRPAITRAVNIQSINWEIASAKTPAPTGTEEVLDTISLVLHFPEITNTEEAFNVLAKKILADVRSALPEYKVSYSKLPDVFTKKSEPGAITFDEDKKTVQIDKINLEATLLLSKMTAAEIAALPSANTPANTPKVIPPIPPNLLLRGKQ